MILQRVDDVLCVVDHQLVGLAGCVAPSLDLLSAVFREAFLVPDDRRDEKNVPLVAQVGQFLEIRQKLLLLFCVVMHLVDVYKRQGIGRRRDWCRLLNILLTSQCPSWSKRCV